MGFQDKKVGIMQDLGIMYRLLSNIEIAYSDEKTEKGYNKVIYLSPRMCLRIFC